MFILSLLHNRNTQSSDIQIIDGDTCIFSFDTLFSIIQQDLEEPSVYYFHILSIHVIVVFYSIIYFIKFLVSLNLSLQNQNIRSYQNYSVFTSFLNTIIYRSSSYFNSWSTTVFNPHNSSIIFTSIFSSSLFNLEFLFYFFSIHIISINERVFILWRKNRKRRLVCWPFNWSIIDTNHI